jgi:hypothetical protein
VNTTGAIVNGQSREIGNIKYTRHKMKTKKTIAQRNMVSDVSGDHPAIVKAFGASSGLDELNIS